jgi:nitroreductase
VAIALDQMMLAAAAAGLGACWIGAFDEKAVKELLGIPERAKVVALSPLGWPASPALLSPAPREARKPRSQVFRQNRF